MKPVISWALGAAALTLLAAGGGYWFGQRGHGPPGEPATATAAAASNPGTPKTRKLLYYRNPMGLADTSSTPKKDPMGMDYVAVFEGEDDAAESGPAALQQITISTEKVQQLGVRTEAASLRVLDQVLRAAGRVEPDERHIYTIAPKFEGYIERLLVNALGQPVAKGQPLFEVYSPDLVSAQREYAIAAQGVLTLKDAGPQAQGSMQQLADSSLLRLKNWDIPEDQIKRLSSTGQAQRTVTFRSPVSGVVTEKKAQQGMRFMPGEMLYQVADLSSVWVIADVFEQDLAQVRVGAKAKVHVNAYPDKEFHGNISYIYPSLRAETRTVPVRVELGNPGGLLKPGMFAQIELTTGDTNKVLAVPESAVIDSGTRSIVLVQSKPGRFEPRTVLLGQRNDQFVQLLQGVSEGEQVVVSANFLIDAESNLKAAMLGMQATPAGPSQPASAAGNTAGTAKGSSTPASAPHASH